MPARGTFGLKRLIDAVRERVEETSIRAVASEIGMSPSGLHVLLQGATPHARTREKLVAWYAARRGGRSTQPQISSIDVDAALRLLVQYAKEDSRANVRARRVREILTRFQTDSGTAT